MANKSSRKQSKCGGSKTLKRLQKEQGRLSKKLKSLGKDINTHIGGSPMAVSNPLASAPFTGGSATPAPMAMALKGGTATGFPVKMGGSGMTEVAVPAVLLLTNQFLGKPLPTYFRRSKSARSSRRSRRS